MTAEVGVINRSAVALAADSAVTSHGGIYDSENKLFTLSKYHPVGVMIYGNPLYMGMPWETIIKCYREERGEKSFSEIYDHANDFFNWISASRQSVLGESVVDGAIDTLYGQNVQDCLQNIDSAISERISKDGNGSVEDIFDNIVDGFIEYYKSLDRISNINGEDIKEEDVREEISNTYKIAEQNRKNYESRNLTFLTEDNIGDKVEKIEKIATLQTSKGWNRQTGIVVSGFGEEEYIPHLFDFNAEPIYNGKMKVNMKRKFDTGKSTIVPFAQGEMVDRFVRGIDPDYKSTIIKYIRERLFGYPKEILEEMNERGYLDIDEGDLEKLESKLEQKSNKELRKVQEDINWYERVEHTNPIVNNLDNLPKDELGVMAETFVNITSFKRRVSGDESETVGGPIDVAIISKGDGFIWTKRKHYFDKELNHHFFQNYFED